MGIAGYLRGRREGAGLSRGELARRAGVSVGLIQKIEQGRRAPTGEALAALFDALGVPAVYREYASSVLQPGLTRVAGVEGGPGRAELDFLEGMPHPAAYQVAPAMDLVAVNGAFARAFPGLGGGGNVIEWLLFDPRARVVIEDWEREVHIAVQAFRHMSAGYVSPERVEEIIGVCSRSADWGRLWSTDIGAVDFDWRPVRIRPVEGGEWTALHVQVLRFEVPRRGWSLYSMVPIP
ncbi:helix-turn-helix domain-containing protein [Nocardia sp. IFM 10818]